MTTDETRMIEVRVDQTGDWAEAETTEAALLAAKTMMEEAYKASGGGIRKPTATFLINGEVVRANVPEHLLWADVVNVGRTSCPA